MDDDVLGKILSYLVVLVLGLVAGIIIGSMRVPPPTHIPTPHSDFRLLESGNSDQAEKVNENQHAASVVSSSKETADLFEKKNWPQGRVANLTPTFANLSTSWRDRTLYYHFKVFPDTVLQRHLKSGKTSSSGFTIRLLDRNRFLLHTIFIPYYRMSSFRNERMDLNGLEVNESIPLQKEDYRFAAFWEVEWE